ncbi:hypothetical protein P4646_19905 [Peribacillus simplex]|uniref:hypothetical protein n=1 Tax=Peribacillus simplex TaxID=1478 RepID=UPI002E1AF9C6|nr:hypothetical protein [Peribacillus simplex]MED4096830.1 hypothetical protein [Peribacillus simplex]
MNYDDYKCSPGDKICEYMMKNRDYFRNNEQATKDFIDKQQGGQEPPLPIPPDSTIYQYQYRIVKDSAVKKRFNQWALIFSGPSINGPFNIDVFYIDYYSPARDIQIIEGFFPGMTERLYWNTYSIWAIG